MADEFNFDLTTQYKPEFKPLATFPKLWETLAKERIEYEGLTPAKKTDYDFFLQSYKDTAEQNIKGTNHSSLRNKLKYSLHLDIKPYLEKSDKDRFDVLKLLHYLENTKYYDKTYDEKTDKKKSRLIIKLMSSPSSEHTDKDNAIYSEYFKHFKGEIGKAVDDADEREKAINWIHNQWLMVLNNINCSVVIDAQIKDFNFQEVNQFLENLLNSISKENIIELQRPDEGIIETFYNMLLASCVKAEINDVQRIDLDFHKEKAVPKDVSELFLSSTLSEPISWEEFKKLISIGKKSLSTEQKKLVWSVLLRKKDVSIEDINDIKTNGYTFAIKYAKAITSYWVRTCFLRDTINLSEWIIVMQELLCIHQNKIFLKFSNHYHNHKTIDIDASLAGAVMHFENSHEFARQIIMQRLTARHLLIYGTNDQLNNKLQTDRYIIDLEKIILSYKNLEDMKAAHNYLFFQVISILATNSSYEDIPDKLYRSFQKRLFEMRSPFINILPDPKSQSNPYFKSLIRVLAQDQYFRLGYNEQSLLCCNEITNALPIIEEAVSKEGLNKEALYQLAEKLQYRLPKFAYNTLADLLADAFGCMPCSIYNKLIPIPIFYGTGNEYQFYAVFDYSYSTHQITVSDYYYIGNDIESLKVYKDILLMDETSYDLIFNLYIFTEPKVKHQT